MSRGAWWGGALVVGALALGALAGCQERLTQPGECPELCPGGTPEVFEEILEPVPQLDSSFAGYADRGSAQVLLVSRGNPTGPDTNIAVIVFAPRPAEIEFAGAARAYTVDSIRLGVGLIARDTAAKNLRFEVHRLPQTLDTTALTYTGVQSLLTPASFITNIPVPDSVRLGPQSIMLRGPETAPLAFGPTDDGRLRLAIAVAADVSTGTRIGKSGSGVPTLFETFVTPDADPAPPQEIEILPEFDTYVSSVNPVPDPNLLTVGGVPSSRALIRFALPPRLRDSASVVRATLELVPAQPIRGLPNDPGTLEVRTLTTDLGAKSPVSPTFVSTTVLPANTTGTVEVEVGQLVRLWQGLNALPSTLELQISPEAGTFTEAAFGSSRVGTPPRIRLEYLRSFPFERP